MLFNVVVSLLLLYVIVKLRLVSGLLQLLLSIVCLPFVLISKCIDYTQSKTKKKTKKTSRKGKKSNDKGMSEQEFFVELHQLLERFNKTNA